MKSHYDSKDLAERIARIEQDVKTFDIEIKEQQEYRNWKDGKIVANKDNPFTALPPNVFENQKKGQDLMQQLDQYSKEINSLIAGLDKDQKDKFGSKLNEVKKTLLDTQSLSTDTVGNNGRFLSDMNNPKSIINNPPVNNPQDKFQQLKSSGLSQQAKLAKTLNAGGPPKEPPPVPPKPQVASSEQKQSAPQRRTTILPPPPPPLKVDDEKPTGPKPGSKR